MNTKTNNLSIYAGAALMIVAAGAVISSPTSGKPTANLGQTPGVVSDVHVANTAAQAVPVVAQGVTTIKGTVGAAQSGAWNVGITGTPNVSIANTPAVTLSGTPTVALSGTPGVKVLNPAISPVPVALVNEGARQPFQKQVHLTEDQSGDASGEIVVPAGWRLVIEHVNGTGFINQADGLFDFQVDTTYKGEFAAFEFKPVPVSDLDHYHTVINETLLAYADAGSSVYLHIQASVHGGGAPKPDGYITITGHLEK